jgi:hypothetical protein
VVEIKDKEPNPDLEIDYENIDRRQIIDADPTTIVTTATIKPEEPTYYEEGEHHFHSQMWVKGTPLHFIVDSGSQTLLHLGQILTARSTQLPLSIVGRPTNLGPPQTSFHMTSFFRRPRFRLYCDVSNVARETLQTWQDRRFKHGKRDV